MLVEVGAYTGNGSDNRDIVLAGAFQPDIVIVIHDAASDSYGVQFAWFTEDSSVNEAMRMSGTGYEANTVQQINANGFQVGNQSPVTNDNNERYIYCAIKKDANAEISTDTWTGNGADNRDITMSTSFIPEFVMIKSNNAGAGVFRHSTHSGDQTSYFQNTAEAANLIQSLGSGTFQIGSDGSVNGSGNKAVSIALKSLEGYCKVGSYTGDGGVSKAITGLGFAPLLVLIKNHTTTNSDAVMSISGVSNNRSFGFAGGNAITNGITAFGSDGFTVGNNARVNAGSSSYMYIAIGNPNIYAKGPMLLSLLGTG